MMISKLELPKTIRLLEKHDVPNDPSLLKRIEKGKTANIVEGYVMFPNEANSELEFTFYAEININNSRLFDLILALSNELPREVSLIFNYSDMDPKFGKYGDKDKLLSFLNEYKAEIVADPFIEIGMIFQTENELIEVFVSDSKYIKFWGVNQNSFLKIMNDFNLKEVKGIEFIDEYPKIREALFISKKNAKAPEDLMQMLDKEFQFI